MSLPPVFAASARDNLLQAALRQFFRPRDIRNSSRSRPFLRTAAWPSSHQRSVGPDHPLVRFAARAARAGEAALRHTSGSPGRCGAVLASRYRAIFDPNQMLERGELFRGSIEDRYVAAFLDAAAPNEKQSRADLTDGDRGPAGCGLCYERTGQFVRRAHPRRRRRCDGFAAGVGRSAVRVFAGPDRDQEFLSPERRHKPFSDQCKGEVLDIVEIARYAEPVLSVPCTARYRPLLATAGNGHLCIVLSPSHGRSRCLLKACRSSVSGTRWHLLDLQTKCAGGKPSATSCFRAPVPDGRRSADSRKGRYSCPSRSRGVAVGAVARPINWTRFVTWEARCRVHRSSLHMLRGRNVHELDPAVLRGLARTDGATVVDRNGRLLAVGAILLHSEPPEPHSSLAVEGARTTAAMAAARFGAVLKVSEDGLITFYDQQERIWDI